jgi:hypothetical protein
MSRFFARLLAVILAGAAFAAALALIVQIRPESLGGWMVMALLGAGALGLPVLVYRLVLGPRTNTGPPNEGEGAGLSMGAGIDKARRNDGERDDVDLFGD